MWSRDPAYAAITWLVDALIGLPLAVRRSGHGPGDIVVSAGDREYRFDLKTAGGGWPSSIRRLTTQSLYSGEHVVLFAETFSPGALELLGQLGLNWVDSHGNVRLVQWPGLVVERHRTTPSRAARSAFRWTESAVDIAEHLLARQPLDITVTALSRQLSWSGPQTSRILQAFDGFEWTERSGGRRGPGVSRQIGPAVGSMLESWSDHIAKQEPPVRRMHVLGRDLISIVSGAMIHAVGSQPNTWAFSGLAAAQLRSSMLSSLPRVDVAVGPEDFVGIELWNSLASSGLRSAGEGGAVVVRQLDAHAFAHVETVLDLPCVSVPRTYAELIAMGGRAKEVGEQLRADTLGY